MEGPLGAGDLNRVGAPGVDSLTPARTGSRAQWPGGGRRAGGEDGGRAVKPVSTAALGVGRHDGATAPVAPVAGAASLSGRAALSGGEPEVSGLRAHGRSVGGAGLAVGGAALGVSGPTAGVECDPAGPGVGPCGQRGAFSDLALGESAAFGIGDLE